VLEDWFNYYIVRSHCIHTGTWTRPCSFKHTVSPETLCLAAQKTVILHKVAGEM